MSKEQIEEMARKTCRNYQQDGNCASDYEPCDLECVYGYCAERIYCAGYRKQSEGEWKRHKENCLHNVCSVCEHPHCREDNFCPNCGAKMKGGAEQ